MRKPNRIIAALLALNAVLLVAVVAVLGEGGLLPRAQAALPDQPDKDGGKATPFNTGEKINQISVQVEAMSRKLGDIEKKLNSGISVKVTEMPEVVVKDPASKKK